MRTYFFQERETDSGMLYAGPIMELGIRPGSKSTIADGKNTNYQRNLDFVGSISRCLMFTQDSKGIKGFPQL